MPESKVRKTSADKKAAKARVEKAVQKSRTQARLAAGTRDWVPWVFVPVGLLGVLWLLVFYVAGYQIPFMAALANWNYLIGLGLIASSFVIATLWK